MTGEGIRPDAFEALGLLVIQPTPFCNIDCRYCYLPNRNQTRRMEPDTYLAIPRFLDGMPLRGKELRVSWHAGEPLVLPPAYYEPIFRSFADSGVFPAVVHNFQTNATLLDDEWCDFIKKWNVKIGVSLDGPASINDLSRIDRAGRGTTTRTLKGVEVLKKNGIPFNVIGVLTRQALKHPDDIWSFMLEIGASAVGFNLEEQEGAHTVTSLAGGETADLVRKFFARLAEHHSASPGILVRELDSMRRRLIAPRGSVVQGSSNRPGAIVSIDVDGNVTTFSPELLGARSERYGTFAWANVKTSQWTALADSPGFRDAWRDIELGITRCSAECEYFPVCGGGDPSNKLAEAGTLDVSETRHCRLSVKAIADVVMNVLEGELGVKHPGPAEAAQ